MFKNAMLILIVSIYSFVQISCVSENNTAAKETLYLNSFNLNPAPLFVLNGVIISSIDTLSSSSIAEIYILKEQKAIDKYGKKGEFGVVEIITKKTVPKP